MTPIVLGVLMFTGVILALVAVLLAARRQLVASGDATIVVNDDPTKALKTPVGSTLLGALSAQGLRRLGLAWRAAAFLPFVVSPVTVAFGLLLLYPAFTASLPLLVAAYALIAYPFIARSLAAALDALPPSLMQAAATLGASPARVAWRVTLPLVAPALRRGTAFAAATMLGEFAVSLFLTRPEWLTLTTLIHQRLGRPGETNLQAALVLALLLLALALAAFVLIEGGARRQAPPHARTA